MVHTSVGVGERTCEANDLYHSMIETGVTNLDGDSKVTLAFGQTNGYSCCQCRSDGYSLR